MTIRLRARGAPADRHAERRRGGVVPISTRLNLNRRRNS